MLSSDVISSNLEMLNRKVRSKRLGIRVLANPEKARKKNRQMMAYNETKDMKAKS